MKINLSSKSQNQIHKKNYGHSSILLNNLSKSLDKISISKINSYLNPKLIPKRKNYHASVYPSYGSYHIRYNLLNGRQTDRLIQNGQTRSVDTNDQDQLFDINEKFNTKNSPSKSSRSYDSSLQSKYSKLPISTTKTTENKYSKRSKSDNTISKSKNEIQPDTKTMKTNNNEKLGYSSKGRFAKKTENSSMDNSSRNAQNQAAIIIQRFFRNFLIKNGFVYKGQNQSIKEGNKNSHPSSYSSKKKIGDVSSISIKSNIQDSDTKPNETNQEDAHKQILKSISEIINKVDKNYTKTLNLEKNHQMLVTMLSDPNFKRSQASYLSTINSEIQKAYEKFIGEMLGINREFSKIINEFGEIIHKENTRFNSTERSNSEEKKYKKQLENTKKKLAISENQSKELKNTIQTLNNEKINLENELNKKNAEINEERRTFEETIQFLRTNLQSLYEKSINLEKSQDNFFRSNEQETSKQINIEIKRGQELEKQLFKLIKEKQQEYSRSELYLKNLNELKMAINHLKIENKSMMEEKMKLKKNLDYFSAKFFENERKIKRFLENNIGEDNMMIDFHNKNQSIIDINHALLNRVKVLKQENEILKTSKLELENEINFKIDEIRNFKSQIDELQLKFQEVKEMSVRMNHDSSWIQTPHSKELQLNDSNEYQSLLASTQEIYLREINELKRQINFYKANEGKYIEEISRLNKQNHETFNNMLSFDKSNIMDQDLNVTIQKKLITPLWEIVNSSKWSTKEKNKIVSRKSNI